MPIEWHYLENGAKRGPITGEQLRNLVETGVVVPHTPLRRIAGSTLSPWCRAAEVRELFPRDVTSEMGGNICPDCGKILTSGRCPVCTAPLIKRLEPIAANQTAPSTLVGSIVAPPPAEPVSTSPASHAHLQRLMEMIRITSVIGVIVAVGAAIGLIVVGYRGQSLSMAGGALGAALVVGLGWIGYLAATSWIELIHVVLEMDAASRDRSASSRRRT